MNNSDIMNRYKRMLALIRRGLSCRVASALIFLAAMAVTYFGEEVRGAVAFVLLISLILVICDDLGAALLPFLMICSFTIKCYDSFSTFIAYKWVIVIAVTAIILHFSLYRKRPTLGPSFAPLCAVAAAVMLGGCFAIGPADYFSGVSLYYVGMLGPGMILLYLAMRANVGSSTREATESHFCKAMYLWGVFCTYMVFEFVIASIPAITECGTIPEFQWSNNVSTMLMFSMPFPFFFARKNPLHLIPGYMMYAAIIVAYSRGGILFGSVEILILSVYAIVASKKLSTRILSIALPLLGVLAVVTNTFGIADITRLSGHFFPNVNADEARMKLLFRSLENFRANILFGQGIGYRGNTDIYDPAKGALYFYHMMIPQIIGSMGLLGIGAYLYQFVIRLRTVFTRVNAYTMCLFISYLGILMMSQVNPGEFAPIPYEMITVLLFVMLEGHDGDGISLLKKRDRMPEYHKHRRDEDEE